VTAGYLLCNLSLTASGAKRRRAGCGLGFMLPMLLLVAPEAGYTQSPARDASRQADRIERGETERRRRERQIEQFRRNRPPRSAAPARPAAPAAHRDHIFIFPLAGIRGLKGFNNLSPHQQASLLTDPKNYQPMLGSMNCSKGCRVVGTANDWKTYKGQPLNEGYRKWLEGAQGKMIDHFEKRIKHMSGD